MPPFQITIRAEAAKQFHALSAHDRGVVQQAIAVKLAASPNKETKAIKRLRTNPAAEYELRWATSECCTMLTPRRIW